MRYIVSFCTAEMCSWVAVQVMAEARSRAGPNPNAVPESRLLRLCCPAGCGLEEVSPTNRRFCLPCLTRNRIRKKRTCLWNRPNVGLLTAQNYNAWLLSSSMWGRYSSAAYHKSVTPIVISSRNFLNSGLNSKVSWFCSSYLRFLY
jgi:hypothetical protein